MSLPPLPKNPYEGDGWDWMSQLDHGWFPVPAWGKDGWDLGKWPLVIFAHYSKDTFAVAHYVEGDVDVKEFTTREERDKETDKHAVWYWKAYENSYAPQSITDEERLGPYSPG